MIRFDPYAVAPPVADWSYIVDDKPIRRAPKGSPRLLRTDVPVVRLAPDPHLYPWRNEHVLVFEDAGVPPTLRVRGTLYLRKREDGADLADFEALVRDPTGDRVASLLVPDHLRDAVWSKVLKVMDWYDREVKRREDGRPPLLTAKELWHSMLPRQRAS